MHILEEQIKTIAVYGCGGTGSHIMNGLAMTDHQLKQANKPGFHVTAYDPDVVTHGNIGRQAFFNSDIGHNKAKVLTERINMYYGTNWMGIASKAPSSDRKDLVIACVDSIKSRESIARSWQKEGAYLIDTGNSRTSGQVLIGQYKGKLANPYLEHDFLINGDEPPEHEEPGCVDPLQRQDLFVNRMVSDYALHLVWSLLKYGRIKVRGFFFDLDKGITNPVKIDDN